MIINLGVSLLVALFFVPSLIDKIGLKRRKKSSLSIVKWKIGEVRFFVWIRSRMRRLRLFQSLLQVADTNTLPLEGGGMYFVIVGIRTTGISIAGKDER